MPTLPVDALRIDERCQPRVSLDPELIDDYAAAMAAGAAFPPLTVYREGETYWLADGFHRLYAAKQAGATEIACDVKPGDLRAAVLHSVGANATHGLRRTNLDKRRAVETLLSDPDWARWSDREIARRCAVDNSFVSKMRNSLLSVNSDTQTPARTYTDRWGNTTTMQTANIGKRDVVTVDQETGEILEDDGEPEIIDAEYVDPTDPATFLIPPTPPAPAREADEIRRELDALHGLDSLLDALDADPLAVGQELALRGAAGERFRARYRDLLHWLERAHMAAANNAHAATRKGLR